MQYQNTKREYAMSAERKALHRRVVEFCISAAKQKSPPVTARHIQQQLEPLSDVEKEWLVMSLWILHDDKVIKLNSPGSWTPIVSSIDKDQNSKPQDQNLF